MVATISPRELADIRSSGKSVELLDVRTPVEFREVHADIAHNMPLDRLDARTLMSERNGSGEPIYVICRSGGRGNQACEKLFAAGLNVVNVEGGTLAWEAAGLPVIRGKKAISLERQVRIVAGFLVLAGAVLAIAVHPYFVALSAFVGAGLMFSGITDTCGMAMLLGKLPWNQVTGQMSGATCKT